MNLALIVSILLSLCSVIPAQAKPLSVLTEEWGPVTFEENGTAQGFAVDIINALQERLTNKASIQVLPWARGFYYAKRQPNVALFTMFRSQERDKYFTFLGPIGYSEITFYGLASRPFPIQTTEDAKKVASIAAIRDSLNETILQNAGFTNVFPTKNPEQEARMLAAGRIDLIATDPLVIKAAFKKIGREDIALKKYLTMEHGDLYIAFSRGTNPETIKCWKRALAAIKKDGTYTKLAKKWLPNRTVGLQVQLVGVTVD